MAIFGGDVRYFWLAIILSLRSFLREKIHRRGCGRPTRCGTGLGIVRYCHQFFLHFGIFADFVFFTGNGEEKSSAGEENADA